MASYGTERAAVDDLGEAIIRVFSAQSKLRDDPAALVLSGKLSAATLIIDNVREQIKERTE